MPSAQCQPDLHGSSPLWVETLEGCGLKQWKSKHGRYHGWSGAFLEMHGHNAPIDITNRLIMTHLLTSCSYSAQLADMFVNQSGLLSLALTFDIFIPQTREHEDATAASIS